MKPLENYLTTRTMKPITKAEAKKKEEYTYNMKSIYCFCVVLCDELGRPYISKCKTCKKIDNLCLNTKQ